MTAIEGTAVLTDNGDGTYDVTVDSSTDRTEFSFSEDVEFAVTTLPAAYGYSLYDANGVAIYGITSATLPDNYTFRAMHMIEFPLVPTLFPVTITVGKVE